MEEMFNRRRGDSDRYLTVRWCLPPSAGFCRCSLPTDRPTAVHPASVDCEVRCSSSAFCLSLSEQGRGGVWVEEEEEEEKEKKEEEEGRQLWTLSHAPTHTRGMHESRPLHRPTHLYLCACLWLRSCLSLSLSLWLPFHFNSIKSPLLLQLLAPTLEGTQRESLSCSFIRAKNIPLMLQWWSVHFTQAPTLSTCVWVHVCVCVCCSWVFPFHVTINVLHYNSEGIVRCYSTTFIRQLWQFQGFRAFTLPIKYRIAQWNAVVGLSMLHTHTI